MMRLDAHFDMLPSRAFMKVGGRMTYEGGKSDPPPAPDYRGAAVEQAAASRDITAQQNVANRPNQYTPWGSTTWNTWSETDPSTGTPVTRYAQNVNLRGDVQGALDSQIAMQRGRSDLAASTMPRVANDVAQPFNYGQFSPRQRQIGSYSLDTSAPQQTTFDVTPSEFVSERKRLEDASFERMRPEHDYQQARLDTKLSNQGLTPGSEAYKRANQELFDLQSRDRFNAIQAGGQEQARMEATRLARQGQAFTQDVTAQNTQNAATQGAQAMDITGANWRNNERAQQIAEEAQRRGMSLNEMNALISGQQVTMPQMPGFIAAQAPQAPQLLSAAQMQGQNSLDAWNAQQMQQQGFQSGLFGTAGTIAGMYAGSPTGSAAITRLFG